MIAALVVFAATACTFRSDERPPSLQVEIVAVRPHDPTAFTEGLVVSGDELIEGTGEFGTSRLVVRDLATLAVRRQVELPVDVFGEGVAVTASSLWQLTWRNHVAIERDPATLQPRREVYVAGEGWGLCAQPGRLVMSDGTSTLTFRNPETFARTGTVTLDGFAGVALNELECTPDGLVYANSFPTDTILRIDPESGRVTGTIDASGLLDANEQAKADVLNGIAHLPGTDRFLLTGKYWPKMFEVRFVGQN